MTAFHVTDVFIARGKVLMGVARWEWEQEEQAATKRAHVASELRRLQLQLAQAEAAARLQVIQTEMDAREAEIELLADATGSASRLVRSDRAVLRKMRHADAEVRVLKKVRASAAARRTTLTQEPEYGSHHFGKRRTSPTPLHRPPCTQLCPGYGECTGDLRRAFAPRYKLEIIDMLQDPDRALADGIIVTPTLLKIAPLPAQKIIGNLADKSQVVLALGGT